MRTLIKWTALSVVLVLTCCQVDGEDRDLKVRTYHGMCDASGAAYLGDGHFVMADDESNLLRIYDLAEGKDLPIAALDVGDFLGATGEKHPESDLEGCTQVGDRLYWITSHARNKDGKWRQMRYRFFATKMVPDGGGGGAGTFSLEPDGKPFSELVLNLDGLKDPSLRPFIGTIGKNDKTGRLAPKEEGLNIESLCASDDGKVLYIGFRNPRPGGKAMLLPLLNPEELISGERASARFGEPIYFDLGGLGIRAMEYSPFHRDHIIAAGAHSGKGSSQLYRWSGDIDAPARRIRALGSFNPETVLVDPASGLLRFFSDDGSQLHKVSASESLVELIDGQCECKDLADPNKRGFRMVELDLPR